jgi:predicted ATPase
MAQVRNDDHKWQQLPYPMRSWDSILSELADPRQAPEVIVVRERVRSWRFYDVLRTDADAPARQLQVGTRTQVLSADGGDLPAALATIRESGAGSAIDQAIEDAFPGGSVEVTIHDGRFGIAFRQPGLLRPLTAAELSDGTLRYLLWVAALLTPRPPDLLVLNEPETSLHPDLLPALGQLIADAAGRTQVLVVTHAGELASAALSAADRAGADVREIKLVKEFGETQIVGESATSGPAWSWPSR